MHRGKARSETKEHPCSQRSRLRPILPDSLIPALLASERRFVFELTQTTRLQRARRPAARRGRTALHTV